jgi:hypothetical protein
MISPLTRITAALALLLLAACGGNSNGSGQNPGEPPEQPVARSFEGRAVKGVIRHGLVEAHEFSAGVWQLIATGFTDADGFFDIDLSDSTGPVRITIRADASTRIVCDAIGGCGEVAVGEETLPPADFRLLTMVPSGEQGGQIAVTPLTHIAARWIEQLPAGLPVTDALINMAHARVADLFSLSPDYAWQLPLDLTDASEHVGAASMLHALLGASFSGIAYSENIDLQILLEAYATEFAGLAGQLLVNTDSEAMRPGLDLIRALAQATLELIDSEDSRNELLASINNLIARWGDNPMTSAGGISELNPQEFAAGMVLLNDLHHYLGLAGIDESGSFLTTQMAQLQWLYNTSTARGHTAGLITIVAETAVLSLIGSMSGLLLEQLDEEIRQALLEQNCLDMSQVEQVAGLNLAEGYAVFCIAESELRLDGVRHGQQIDVVIGVAPLSLAAPMEYSLRGGGDAPMASVVSATSTGTLAGTMTLTIAGFNTDPVLDIANLNITVALQGAGSLVNNSSGQGFDVSLDASGELDLAGLSSGEPVLLLQINDGQLTSPFGDQLWALTDPVFCQGRLPLNIAIADTAALDACFGFEAFGMPEMHMTVGGTLAGLFEFIGQILAGLGTFSGSFADLVNGLDPSVLTLLGDARLKIIDASRIDDGHTIRDYQFGLDNNRLDVTFANTGDELTFYATSLDGGYIFSGSTLIATVHSDWHNLGATLKFTDGSEDRHYFLGSVGDVIDENLVQLLLQSLIGVVGVIGGLSL